MSDREADLIDGAGVGGTLAGNTLASAAARATLTEVLTEGNFEHMIAVAGRYVEGVADVIDSRSVPWTILQLGARAEYRFCPEAPRSGGESFAAADHHLDEYLHLYSVNRGILMTPFHNMALMCSRHVRVGRRPPYRDLRRCRERIAPIGCQGRSIAPTVAMGKGGGPP